MIENTYKMDMILILKTKKFLKNCKKKSRKAAFVHTVHMYYLLSTVLKNEIDANLSRIDKKTPIEFRKNFN